MNSESQAEIGSQSVAGFLTGLAAKSPTPGGGAVAAITAALADALGSMVVRYSIGKRALVEHEALHQQSLTELEKLRVRALDHARADAEAYSRLNDLMRLPAEDPRRTAEWPAAVSAAIDAPMLVLIDAMRLLSLLTDLAGKISAMLASDLAIAAVLGDASARAAAWNVRVNLPFVDDPAARDSIEQRLGNSLAIAASARS